VSPAVRALPQFKQVIIDDAHVNKGNLSRFETSAFRRVPPSLHHESMHTAEAPAQSMQNISQII
jgi:hypothetical protein